jgi:hypothetical protein
MEDKHTKNRTEEQIKKDMLIPWSLHSYMEHTMGSLLMPIEPNLGELSVEHLRRNW